MPTDIYLSDNAPRMRRPDLIITLRANYQAGNHLEVIRLCHWEMVAHIGLYGPPRHLRPGRSIGNHHVYDWTRNEDYPEEEPPIQQAVIGDESRFGGRPRKRWRMTSPSRHPLLIQQLLLQQPLNSHIDRRS